MHRIPEPTLLIITERPLNEIRDPCIGLVSSVIGLNKPGFDSLEPPKLAQNRPPNPLKQAKTTPARNSCGLTDGWTDGHAYISPYMLRLKPENINLVNSEVLMLNCRWQICLDNDGPLIRHFIHNSDKPFEHIRQVCVVLASSLIRYYTTGENLSNHTSMLPFMEVVFLLLLHYYYYIRQLSCLYLIMLMVG